MGFFKILKEKIETAMIQKTFKKSERLYKKKLIQELFSKGSSFYLHPFKVLYLINTSESTHQVLFTVPKRTHKKAVERNKIKRRLREGFRLNKHQLDISPKLLIAYIYTSKQVLSFDETQKGVVKSIARLNQLLEKYSANEKQKN